jgi:dihydroorotate dehydrogenase electron transfer subunit
MGFNTKNEIFCEEDFKKLNLDVKITTVDGSFGIKGFAAKAMEDTDYDYVYCCGPLPMLKSVFDKAHAEGQYSFEERMGCGFGACMGCSCKTKYGAKRICEEGPVLKSDEIVW